MTLIYAANAAHKHLEDKRIMLGEDFERKENTMILEYNQLVKHCQEARWAFIVQRHCVGFTIKNH